MLPTGTESTPIIDWEINTYAIESEVVLKVLPNDMKSLLSKYE